MALYIINNQIKLEVCQICLLRKYVFHFDISNVTVTLLNESYCDAKFKKSLFYEK